MSHARIFLETLPLMMFEGKVDPELWPWKNPFHISQVICQPISFLSFYIYVMIFLLKTGLCIKVIFMHNSCWFNYYDKCYVR